MNYEYSFFVANARENCKIIKVKLKNSSETPHNGWFIEFKIEGRSLRVPDEGTASNLRDLQVKTLHQLVAVGIKRDWDSVQALVEDLICRKEGVDCWDTKDFKSAQAGTSTRRTGPRNYRPKSQRKKKVIVKPCDSCSGGDVL